MTIGGTLRQSFRRDRVLQVTLGLGLALLAVCRLTAHLKPAWSRVACDLSDVSMLGVMLFAFLRVAPRDGLERRFWQLLSLAMGSWLLVTLVNLAAHASLPSHPALALLRNLGYTFIYVWMILGLELKPHVPAAAPREARFRWLEASGAALAALGLFVYLAGVPWLIGAEVYWTKVPETLLYLCLDGLLLLRLAALLGQGSFAWRLTYAGLMSAVVFWAAGDGLEVMRWAGRLSEATLGALLDALWLPPFLGLAFAAAARGLVSSESASAAPGDETRVVTPGRGFVLLALTLLLPLVHAAFVGLDVWEPGRERTSAIWVIGLSLVLAVLTAIYLRGIEGLAAERARGLAQANHEMEGHVVALKAARDEADAANRAKTGFLAAMSHEIRTPMNGVLGTVSLLQRSKLDEQQQRLTSTIQRSGQALLAIINEILDLSRLEAGRLRLESEVFDVGGTVEEVVESLAELARGKRLELACLVEGLREPLRGDRSRLRQILVNLVGNAIKFTERGEVAVFARAITSDVDGVTVRVEVADTGIGIPAESASLVFEAFGQTSSGCRAGGSGLGLAISRQLAVLMGGELDFESEAGRGSVFRLTVRLDRAPEAAAGRPLSPPPVARVLIAEPGTLGRFSLERQCADLGIEAVVVSESAAALRALRESAARGEPCEVALVGAGLLAAGEGDLLRGIREDPALVRTRVVSVGRDPGDDGQRGPDLAVLQKPVLRRALLEALGPSLPSTAGSVPPRIAAPRPVASRRGLALVVEDNPVNQAVADGMLGLLGWKVDVAPNGPTALERLDSARYDVVLMDCMMPGMDGFEVTAELRRREQRRGGGRTPVVAVTAIAMTGDRERCLAAGMDDYLAKPFRIETLEATLARVTGAAEEAIACPFEAGPDLSAGEPLPLRG